MKTRWLLNLALLVLVLGLAWFAWQHTQDAARDPRAPLTSLSPADITRVRVERGQQAPIVLERKDDGWRLTQPINARASGFAVDNLLRLAQAPVQTTLPAPLDRARYGLTPPSATVRLDDVVVAFGAMHPMQDWHYVQVGDAVHLIGSRFYAPVAMGFANFLDTRLIEPSREPTGFTFPGFKLERAGDAWRRVPEDKNLSSDRIHDFIEEWRHARALSVARYDGRAVLERVQLRFGGDQPQTLTLGVLARKPELVLYRADEGLEYHFPEETGKRLLSLSGVKAAAE